MEIDHSRRNRFVACAFALGAGHADCHDARVASRRGGLPGEGPLPLLFASQMHSQAKCTDGFLPVASLIMDAAGNPLQHDIPGRS